MEDETQKIKSPWIGEQKQEYGSSEGITGIPEKDREPKAASFGCSPAP